MPGHVAYEEHRAPPDLADEVECVWTLRVGPGGSHVQRVLPDGCIDLVHVPETAVAVAGPSTRAFMATIPAGGVAVGLRFRPGAAPALLGTPALALRDLSPSLDDV